MLVWSRSSRSTGLLRRDSSVMASFFPDQRPEDQLKGLWSREMHLRMFRVAVFPAPEPAWMWHFPELIFETPIYDPGLLPPSHGMVPPPFCGPCCCGPVVLAVLLSAVASCCVGESPPPLPPGGPCGPCGPCGSGGPVHLVLLLPLVDPVGCGPVVLWFFFPV